MRSKWCLVVCILFLLPSCFFNKKQRGNKHTFFVQATLNSPVIKELQDKVGRLIDNIIKEELGIEQDKNFPIFWEKKRQAITVYYVDDLFDNNEPIGCLMYLFVEPVLDALQKPVAPQDVMLSSKVDFFGEEKNGLCGCTDFVVLIDDPNKELVALNENMKRQLHYANESYKRAYQTDLYDIAKSEKHAYLPHLSIGQLRTNYIKYLVKDPAKANEVLERIKGRIIKVVSDAISNLAPQDLKLSFDALAIYSPKKRRYVKERVL